MEESGTITTPVLFFEGEDMERTYIDINVQLPQGYKIIKTKIKLNKDGSITLPLKKK